MCPGVCALCVRVRFAASRAQRFSFIVAPPSPLTQSRGRVSMHSRRGAAACDPRQPPFPCSGVSNASEVHSRLPTLHNATQHTGWTTYLESVYGHRMPAAAFPIHLRLLGWLYLADLPSDFELHPARLHYQCAPARGHAWTGPECCFAFPESRISSVGTFVRSIHGDTASPALRGRSRIEELPQPGVQGPSREAGGGDGFPSYTWIEVVRVDLSHPLERCAPWYYAASGSGIWWNTGRTHVADARGSIAPGVTATQQLYFPTFWHREALPNDTHRVRHGQHWCAGSAELQRLLLAGIETLQFPHSFPNPRMELIDLRFWNDSTYSMRPCAGEYRSGWNAREPCACRLVNTWMIGCRPVERVPTPCR